VQADQPTHPHIVRAYRKDGRILLVLSGSLVLQNSEMLRNRINRYLEPSCQGVDLYLRDLGFIDSSGLGVLVGFHVMAKKKKVDFRLISPAASHMQLFEATRLTSVFNILGGAAGEQVRAEFEKPELEIDASVPAADPSTDPRPNA
jgi:anti-anti-sigma factor